MAELVGARQRRRRGVVFGALNPRTRNGADRPMCTRPARWITSSHGRDRHGPQTMDIDPSPSQQMANSTAGYAPLEPGRLGQIASAGGI